ncbi:periplasmic nitrate reductase, NapE protein [Gammaproteobacteria bacterium]|nr:periplasmic nitrate reductase, NapE protein [Gammaproteobacteria bacterium]
MSIPPEAQKAVTLKEERRCFLFVVVFAAPILAVLIVSGWGFSVWIGQLLLGPPGS